MKPFHAQAECVHPDGSVSHVDPHSMEEVKTEGFLPKGKIIIGVTSGASTPDAYMEQVRHDFGGVGGGAVVAGGSVLAVVVLFLC